VKVETKLMITAVVLLFDVGGAAVSRIILKLPISTPSLSCNTSKNEMTLFLSFLFKV